VADSDPLSVDDNGDVSIRGNNRLCRVVHHGNRRGTAESTW
jgi:hypothetical protein